MPRTTLDKSPTLTRPTQDCKVSKLSPVTLAYVADFFKVLSEVSRLQIVCCLKSGEKNVTQIMEATSLGQANVSKHLKLLAQAGIVTRTQVGVSVYYQIANPFLFELCDLVCDSLLSQFEKQNEQLQQLKILQKIA